MDGDSLATQLNGPEPALLARRLKQLEGLGLAAKTGPSGWVLAEAWQRSLRALGERGDILPQPHRALRGGDAERFHVVRPGQALPDGRGGASERTLVGRVVRKGLGDEVSGRTFYAVVETPTGDAYHVTVGARVADPLRVGDLVSLGTQREPAVQPVDRHLAQVAAAHHGVYQLTGNPEEPNARFAARRLRDLERAGVVASRAPGQWTVPPDLLAQLEKRHREGPARYRLSLEALPIGLDAQVGHRGPVWLDTVDVAGVAAKGFGAEVRAAVERRHDVLRERGVDPADFQGNAKVSGLEGRTVGREMARPSGLESGRVAGAGEPPHGPELARRVAGEAFGRQHRMTFLEKVPERFAGRIEVGPAGSGYLAVSDGARFVLVPAAPESRALIGTTVEVARDAQGRFVGVRPRGLDLGR